MLEQQLKYYINSDVGSEFDPDKLSCPCCLTGRGHQWFRWSTGTFSFSFHIARQYTDIFMASIWGGSHEVRNDLFLETLVAR